MLRNPTNQNHYEEIRRAAQAGTLEKVDPNILTAENIPLGSDEHGPIASAASTGQLAHLPTECRTVHALLLCGHPRVEDPTCKGTFEDGFYQAAAYGKLHALPDDPKFKKDLLANYPHVSASLKRAIQDLEWGANYDKPNIIDRLRALATGAPKEPPTEQEQRLASAKEWHLALAQTRMQALQQTHTHAH